LLKNGNVLSAIDIAPEGKLVSVRLDETGDVRIPTKDVVKIGRDKLELYYYQVSKTTRWEAGEHWQLAKWCLRQGLVEQSHLHYEQLKQLSGNHAKFKQLDIELKQALLQDPVMKAALSSAFPSTTASQASHRGDSDNRLLANANAVDGGNKSANVTGENRNIANSAVNLDRNTQDYFRQNLQPFLAMRCGQAGCHGAYGKTDFHIARSGVLHGKPSSEISLQSAIRFLDDENIEATKLWINATNAHGTQTTPSLTSKDSSERELLGRLRLWHQAVLRSTAVVTMSPMVQVATNPIVGSSPHSPLNSIERLPASPALATQRSPQTGTHVQSVSPSQVSAPEIGDDLMMLEREIAKLEEKERARKTTTRHDPEEFNRRFGNSTP
jgi:hypothetical protein